MLEFKKLNHHALEYIIDELDKGFHLSSWSLTQQISQGVTYSFVENSFMPESKNNCVWSLVHQGFTNHTKEMREYGGKFVDDYLQKDAQHYMLFETFDRKGEKILDTYAYPHFFIDEYAYGYISSTKVSGSAGEYLKFTSAYPTVIALCKLVNGNPFIPCPKFFHTGDFDDIIMQVDHLIIGAFDEEGYVYWSGL